MVFRMVKLWCLMRGREHGAAWWWFYAPPEISKLQSAAVCVAACGKDLAGWRDSKVLARDTERGVYCSSPSARAPGFHSDDSVRAGHRAEPPKP